MSSFFILIHQNVDKAIGDLDKKPLNFQVPFGAVTLSTFHSLRCIRRFRISKDIPYAKLVSFESKYDKFRDFV